MDPTGERYLPQMRGVIEYEHLNRYFFVIQQVDLKGKTVVDLASGEGYGSEILSRVADKVIGIDISIEAVEHAKRNYKRENLQFVEGDACNIPLKDNFADVFVSFETIEHHDRHSEMLAEIKRVLKPDGVLIISSPDKKYYTDIPGYKNIYHVKELYYEEFKHLISDFFKNNYFFLQNNFSGSVITADYPFKTEALQTMINTDGNVMNFVPLYNLSISTDSSDFMPVFNQFHFGNHQLLTEEDVFQAQQKIRRTDEYRLGKKILKRLKFIRKFL